MVKILRIIFLSFIFILLSQYRLSSQTNDGNRYAANSVLASGDWYKIKISGSGFYKLSYEDLQKIGLKKPGNVKVHGYGGWILDEDFRTEYIDDLPEITIWMSKSRENFGPGDYILFYGRGDIKWTYNSNQNEFEHEQNPYSTETFYFLTENDKSPRTIPEQESLLADSVQVSAYDDYALYEKELTNIIQSGREFYGEEFRLKTLTINIPLPGIISDSLTRVRYELISGAAQSGASFNVILNGEEKSIAVGGTSGEYTKANSRNVYEDLRNITSNLPMSFSYKQSSTGDNNVHLNYVRVNYSRNLEPYGATITFRSKKTGHIDYKISKATNNIRIFDVTDNIDVKEIKASLTGTELVFGGINSSSQKREYALVDLSKVSSLPTPELVEKVKNQNLHALEAAEMIIIVQPLLQSHAEELANFHKDDSGLESLIVNPDNIFNEFSSGKPDATAYRRFVKMFYDRAKDEDSKPKYLLLFGDGSYDNRFITNEWRTNEKRGILLTYQTKSSLSESGSYTTDDYFGFLDDSEGSNISSAKLRIGIGRLPVRNANEASIALDKIKRYVKNEEPGIWQNTVTFVSDDAVASDKSTTSEMSHIKQSNSYAEYLKANYPAIINNKIYEDAYERVRTINGNRYPDAQKVLIDKLNKGTLVLNYVGHGSTSSWTHELLMAYPDFESLSNTKLPLWVTATCDFSRFDDASRSAGEAAFLNPKGGAIALFSTVRIVYIDDNDRMSSALYKYLFEEENGQSLRLGDIMRKAKCDNSLDNNTNKLKFLLLGDPALRLNYPDNNYKVEIQKINGTEISNDPSEQYQIKALSNNLIEGAIVDMHGNTIEDFNGSLESLVFDNEQSLVTRGYKKDGETMDTRFNYKDYTNIIFTGKSKINDGKFSLSFVTPKDILYSEGTGKMTFYAYCEDTGKDASGYFINYNVNGTADDVTKENDPPEIEKIYLNTESFKPGDKTNTTPQFYAYVKDKTGINLSSTIGHNISLILDGKTAYNLTPYFENSGEENGTEGYVQYQLPKLTEGEHTLLFTVWDVWNNSQKQEIKFIAEEDYQPQIYEFKILGNPAKDETKFRITSNIPGTGVNVRIDVYSLSGVHHWTYEEKAVINGSSVYEYTWDLVANNGLKLPKGIYLCKITIISNNKIEASKAQKLIVID